MRHRSRLQNSSASGICLLQSFLKELADREEAEQLEELHALPACRNWESFSGKSAVASFAPCCELGFCYDQRPTASFAKGTAIKRGECLPASQEAIDTLMCVCGCARVCVCVRVRVRVRLRVRVCVCVCGWVCVCEFFHLCVCVC